MGDSDDDQDRGRSRDKFRRERSDYNSGGDRNRSNYREKRPWRGDESGSGRRRSRDEYEHDSRKRFSGGSGSYGRGGREWSPPAKRMRREWTGFPAPGMMMPYGMRPPWSMPAHPAPHQMPPGLPVEPGMGDNASRTSKHTMLSFKQFLTRQEDDIEEVDAITSYNSYKSDFKKKLIEEFFEEHKEEDWLISKYHPKRVKENKEKEAANLQRRVQAFSYLLESGLLDKASLTADNSDQIIKIMDSAVIKMEGGSEVDLLSLEDPPPTSGEGEETGDKTSPSLTMESTDESSKIAEQAKEYGQQRESKSGSPNGSSEGSKEDEKMTEPATSETKEEGDSPNSTEPHPPENGVAKPRALHITRSVYIRHIPAKISAEDIIEVCRTIPGFLRIAFADPAPDRGYERRGWATFTAETDVKDVLSKLSTKKIKDCQLSCMVNRELTRRVKHCPSSAWARRSLHSDLQHLLKLIKFFDEKAGLWEYAPPGEEEPQSNPILDFSDDLLEEEPVAMTTSADDEEGAISDPGNEVVEGTDEKVKLLDQLLWYLRIVHSLDYYGGTVLPPEDSMPHRCGLFTIRTQPPDTLEHQEVSDYVEGMEEKVQPLVVKKGILSETEINKLGKKDPEAEEERFVELNTQKLAESKYLCPLSGKKFKGPDYVRKHIFNKHMDKVEDFKQEAVFFNNYIRDPDRPMPEESTISSSVLPSIPKTPGSAESPLGGVMALGSGGSPWDQGRMGMFGRGGGFGPSIGGGFTPPEMMNRGGGFRGRGGGRRGRGRRVVNYEDLDAPDEMY
ncbi:serrate RNA effector molecule homolog [Halichondria panicea]|uniref:serrate RNA effector molecule homolog n=1 Tax=Halichondria panicea TaxID=6063 RepID=UPI00312BA923